MEDVLCRAFIVNCLCAVHEASVLENEAVQSHPVARTLLKVYVGKW